MTTSNDYRYCSTPAPRQRSLISEGTITVVVSSRNGSVQTSFCVQDPSAPPAHDLASVFRQLFQHAVALVRLTFALCVMSLKPAVSVCCFLSERLLRWLDSILANMPHSAQFLGTFFKSQIRNRWPRLWKLICCTVVLPVHLMQAIIDFDEATRSPPTTLTLRGNGIAWDGQIDNVVTIRLLRPSPLPTAQCDYRWYRADMGQRSIPTASDDIPTLEERSVRSSVSHKVLESSPPSDGFIRDLSQSKVTPTEESPKPAMKDDDQSQSAAPDMLSYDLCGTSARAREVSYCSSVDPLQVPQECPNDTIRPMHRSDEVNLNHPRQDAGACGADTIPADVETSSVSSDSAHAESFSPVSLPIPYTNRKDSLACVRILATCSPQEGHDIQQRSLVPFPAPGSPTPPGVHRSANLDSNSSSAAKGASTNTTKWARKVQYTSSDLQLACNDPFHPRDDADFCASGTTSCYDEQYTPTPRSSTQQQSEADECNETCISCETCDRRHKRTRGSRIPRRVKTLDQLRRRSSSFASCHSAPSTGSASTVVRRRLQKRKVKVY